MLIKLVAYLLIAFQIPLVLCGPQGLNFNGSNPYYDSYLQNWGNNDNLNYHSTTQKSLYPTLYPQIPNTTPQPYYAKGQHYPNPNTNYFNRNSSFQNPSNNYGTNNFNNSVGWNTNFNPYTTPSSTYQPYGQYSTTTAKPPVTTFPPYSPTGSFNRYNQTNSYPAFNRTNPTYPSYHHNNINRTNPNYPPYQPQSTLPPYTPWANNFSNYHPQPNFPSSYPVSNKTNPTYPSYNNNNINRTNPMYPPYQPQSTPSPNSFTNYRPSYPTSPSYPVSNRTTPTYPTYPTYNNYNNNNRTNPTKTNNFHNTSSFNHNSNRYDNQYNPQNSNRYDNQYNPQYQPSAPALMPSKPTFDQNGTPLATFSTYHSNQPIDDYLFNYDNLHHRRPINDMQSGQFRQSNDVPLAPFPGEKPPTYNSNSQVPLAPFPG